MNSSLVRNLAKQLVGEASIEEFQAKKSPLEFTVCENLRIPISSLAGSAGFQALLSRALKLAKLDFPRLSSVKVDANGQLKGLAELRPLLTRAEAAHAEIAVLTCMLELLCIFLGETLTVRLVRDLLPGAYLDEVTSAKDIKYEA